MENYNYAQNVKNAALEWAKAFDREIITRSTFYHMVVAYAAELAQTCTTDEAFATVEREFNVSSMGKKAYGNYRTWKSRLVKDLDMHELHIGNYRTEIQEVWSSKEIGLHFENMYKRMLLDIQTGKKHKKALKDDEEMDLEQELTEENAALKEQLDLAQLEIEELRTQLVQVTAERDTYCAQLAAANQEIANHYQVA